MYGSKCRYSLTHPSVLDMTYNVFGGTLSLTQSINLIDPHLLNGWWCSWLDVLLCLARHLILPSGALQISRVRQRDEAVYRCVAVNRLSREQRTSPSSVHLHIAHGRIIGFYYNISQCLCYILFMFYCSLIASIPYHLFIVFVNNFVISVVIAVIFVINTVSLSPPIYNKYISPT